MRLRRARPLKQPAARPGLSPMLALYLHTEQSIVAFRFEVTQRKTESSRPTLMNGQLNYHAQGKVWASQLLTESQMVRRYIDSALHRRKVVTFGSRFRCLENRHNFSQQRWSFRPRNRHLLRGDGVAITELFIAFTRVIVPRMTGLEFVAATRPSVPHHSRTFSARVSATYAPIESHGAAETTASQTIASFETN